MNKGQVAATRVAATSTNHQNNIGAPKMQFIF